MFFSTFVFLTLALKVYAESENSTRQVYFSLIVSGGENGYRSTGGIPSINLALDAVRKRQLLPGYNLTHGEIRNSKVCCIGLLLHGCKSITQDSSGC